MDEPKNSNPPLPMPAGTGMPLALPSDPPLSDLLCVSGPDGVCDHLWEFTTDFPNADPEAVYKHTRRFCQRGSEDMELEGTAVYSCNRYVSGLVGLQKTGGL